MIQQSNRKHTKRGGDILIPATTSPVKSSPERGSTGDVLLRTLLS